MKCDHRLLFAGAALLLGTAGSTFVAIVRPQPSIAFSISATIAQVQQRSGQFVSAAHPTAGKAQIVVEGNQRFLEFTQAFKSDRGPDLYVLLHQEAMPQSYGSEKYISLGKLKKLRGMQRYAIPKNVKLENFASAVIWCKKFNVTFGYAPL